MQGLGPGCPPASNVTLTVFSAVVNLPLPPKTGAGVWRPRVGWAEGEFPARLPSPGKAKNAPCRAQRSGLAVAGISGAAPRIPPFQEWLLLPACPSRMTRAQRPLIAANMANMAARPPCARIPRRPKGGGGRLPAPPTHRFLARPFLARPCVAANRLGRRRAANLAAFVRRRQASEPAARLEPQDMN